MEGSSNKVLKSDPNVIDTLPKLVLHHILSFLDMKEVVGTSLLSKRWRYIWASVPVLKFDHGMWNTVRTNGDKIRKRGFMNFVDKVLFLRDGSKVSLFQIFCSTFCDGDRIAAWLTVAARREFQEIYLKLSANRLRKLPDLLFTSAVTLFKLRMSLENPIEYLTQVPHSVSFAPQLKTLRLDFVELPKGNSNGEFTLSCPVLENLMLFCCNQSHLKALIISVPQLKKLIIMISRRNLVGYCHLKLCTPNLKALVCNRFWYSSFSLMTCSSLAHAQIYFSDDQPDTHNLVKVLEAVSCATVIELSFADYAYTLTELPAKFSNLRRIKLEVCGGKKLSIRVVLNLLNSAPRLESLILNAPELDDYDERVVPFKCDRLNSVEIGRIKGTNDEVKFLDFLLKNVVVLEKLMIKMCVGSSDSVKENFGGQILSRQRASKSITVVIV